MDLAPIPSKIPLKHCVLQRCVVALGILQEEKIGFVDESLYLSKVALRYFHLTSLGINVPLVEDIGLAFSGERDKEGSRAVPKILAGPFSVERADNHYLCS